MTVLTLLDKIWAWQQGGFLTKNLQMTLEHRVFERMGVFLTKYMHESSVFSREWTIFNKIRRFFLIFHEKFPAAMPILAKNNQFCQNNIILWSKKVNRVPFFFFRFLMKTWILQCPYFVYKTSTQKHYALMSIFCQKASILFKTWCCHIILFKFAKKNAQL